MERPKNIVFIMPDQLRADFLSCYGATCIETPNIDALAADGVKYERAFTPSPLCVPARAALLTGRNAVRNGVFDNDCWLRPDHNECGQITWPQRLTDAGYLTAAFGKMHFYPWDAKEGFQHRVIAEDKRHIDIMDDYAEYLESKGLHKMHISEYEGYEEHQGAVVSPIPHEDQVDTWVARKTCEYLRKIPKDQPFAVMVGLPGPHCPYDPPAELLEGIRPEDMPAPIPATDASETFIEGVVTVNKLPWNGIDYTDFSETNKLKMRAHYAALVKQIDRAVGGIVDTLKEEGLYDDTMIIFSSDHGDMLGDYGYVGKFNFFEPAIHIPLIAVNQPGDGPRDISYPDIVSLYDIHSTILKAAGLEHPENSDAMPLPVVSDTKPKREYIFGITAFFGIKGYMLRDKRYKLCRYTNGLTALFDLETDPREQNNLIDKPETMAIQAELDKILTKELMDGLIDGHMDKFVEEARNLADPVNLDKNYGRPGWHRPYPYAFVRTK